MTKLANLSRRVSVGSSWLLANTIGAKALGILSQIAMGWFLSERDFGVYAITISVSTFASLLRDGGLSRLLIQRGASYESLEGPVFWMILACNTLAAILLVALAPFAARFYSEPQLVGMLGMVALSLPLSAPTAVFIAKISIDLRFRELGAIQLVSSAIRYVSMVTMAWRGFGAASFVVPVLITGIFELAAYGVVAKSFPWRKPAGVSTWPSMFGQSKWILFGAFAIGLMNNGAYFALGELVSKEVVGIYFFAFQIVLQVGVALSNNLFQVLLPAFSLIIDDLERSRLAILRSINVVLTASTWMSVILVPMYEPLERLLWHGKWAASILPVQILAMCFSPSVALSVVMAAQTARGRFKECAVMSFGLATGTMVSVAIGALLGHGAVSIAVSYGLFNLLSVFVYTGAALKDYRIGAATLFRSTWPLGIVALVSAAIATFMREIPGISAYPFVQVAFAGAGFTVCYLLGIRLMTPSCLRQTIDVLPLMVGQSLRRLVLLPIRE